MDRIEAKHWLEISNTSSKFYQLLNLSNTYSRTTFKNKGYIFAQIGINADKCSRNCKFCSMAASHYVLDSVWEKDIDTLRKEVKQLIKCDINDLFLMTTADYPIDKFLKIASEIRKILPDSIRLVANIGDFDINTAKELKNVGFTGAYHIKRLREGVDTLVDPEIRIKTIETIVASRLELYYCIEPIGPEHTYDEILDEIYFAKQFPIGAMAVMRRTPVEGTPLANMGQIDAMELTKIAAVTNLIIQPTRSMNVHEPLLMTMLAGVNQLYAELGANPRDTISETSNSRGFTVEKAWAMLADGGYFQNQI